MTHREIQSASLMIESGFHNVALRLWTVPLE